MILFFKFLKADCGRNMTLGERRTAYKKAPPQKDKAMLVNPANRLPAGIIQPQ